MKGSPSDAVIEAAGSDQDASSTDRCGLAATPVLVGSAAGLAATGAAVFTAIALTTSTCVPGADDRNDLPRLRYRSHRQERPPNRAASRADLVRLRNARSSGPVASRRTHSYSHTARDVSGGERSQPSLRSVRPIERRGDEVKRAVMGLLTLTFLRRRRHRPGRHAHR
jgi:hypothetical protein